MNYNATRKGEKMSEKGESLTSTDKTQIVKPEGTYTVIYGAHNRRTDLRLLPRELDAFVLEWNSDELKPKYFSGLDRQVMAQLSSVLEYAEVHKIPVYHTDLNLSPFFVYPEVMFWPPNPRNRVPSSNLREAVVAQKEEWIMRNVPKTKHLVTVIGAGHRGIESQIKKSGDDRLKALRRWRHILKMISKQKSIYAISKFEFDSKG